jgi:phage shock protein E
MSFRRRRLSLVGLILAVMTVAACGGGATSPAPTSVNGAQALPAEVSVAEAASLRDAGALILDVRETDEWVAGHIPGATLISLGDLASRVDELPSDRTIVVVCRSGNRSAQGRDILQRAGFGSVTSMAGGMIDWIASGLPVQTGS